LFGLSYSSMNCSSVSPSGKYSVREQGKGAPTVSSFNVVLAKPRRANRLRRTEVRLKKYIRVESRLDLCRPPSVQRAAARTNDIRRLLLTVKHVRHRMPKRTSQVLPRNKNSPSCSPRTSWRHRSSWRVNAYIALLVCPRMASVLASIRASSSSSNSSARTRNGPSPFARTPSAAAMDFLLGEADSLLSLPSPSSTRGRLCGGSSSTSSIAAPSARKSRFPRGCMPDAILKRPHGPYKI